MAQATCDRCRAPLTPDAAYCDRCGERTRKARRNVRLAIRIEVLFLVLMLLLVFGFTFVYYVQK
jgi:predicted nucleic acid-binding Zn ribbon protein